MSPIRQAVIKIGTSFLSTLIATTGLFIFAKQSGDIEFVAPTITVIWTINAAVICYASVKHTKQQWWGRTLESPPPDNDYKLLCPPVIEKGLVYLFVSPWSEDKKLAVIAPRQKVCLVDNPDEKGEGRLTVFKEGMTLSLRIIPT